jgi:hypothetical protein
MINTIKPIVIAHRTNANHDHSSPQHNDKGMPATDQPHSSTADPAPPEPQFARHPPCRRAREQARLLPPAPVLGLRRRKSVRRSGRSNHSQHVLDA